MEFGFDLSILFKRDQKGEWKYCDEFLKLGIPEKICLMK
jgi:hypothetical protein